MLTCFRIGSSAPEAVDLLDEEARGHATEPKIPDAWSPYESKTVSRPFNTPTNDYIKHAFRSIDVPPRHP